MDPTPAHVLVTGLTGNVGYGVAQAALQAGHRVTGLLRRPADAERLQRSLGPGLHPLVVDLAEPQAVRALQTQLVAGPALDHAVIAVGAWWQKGPVHAQPASEWAAVRAGLLDAQVHAALALLPLLRERAGASYTLITGAAGAMSLPGTGLLVTAVAGVMGLSRMLRAEHAQTPLRVNEVLIQTRIERQGRDGVTPALAFGTALLPLYRADGPRSHLLRFDAEGLR
jgi:NAD(P)-dependent dehydrogenase (short-subunit alcohol dehydrogenase family)